MINYDELMRAVRTAQKAYDQLVASGTLDRIREAGAGYDRLKAYLDSLTEEEREEFLRSLKDDEEE